MPAIERARQAGVTVIAVDTPTRPESAVDALFATNNVQAGELIGRYAKARADEDGIQPKIAMLDLAPGITSGVLRHAGFLKGFGIRPGDPAIVGSVDTEGDKDKGRAGMAQLLKENPDINIVYTVNEPAAFGAIEALEAAGKSKDDVIVVSVDGGCDAIKNGRQARRHRRDLAAVPGEHGQGGRAGDRRRGARRPEAERLPQHGRRAHHRRPGGGRRVQGRGLRGQELLGGLSASQTATASPKSAMPTRS